MPDQSAPIPPRRNRRTLIGAAALVLVLIAVLLAWAFAGDDEKKPADLPASASVATTNSTKPGLPPTMWAPFSVDALTVTPAVASGAPASVKLTVSGTAVVQDLAASVRDARNVDDSQLDFPHWGQLNLNGSRTFTASMVEPTDGTYRVTVAYQIDDVWWHISNRTASFTVGAKKITPQPDTPQATTPPTASDNPLGSTGARSGLTWNSGIWPLSRSASGASYSQALAYAEHSRGRDSDLNMTAQWFESWDKLTQLQSLDFLNATPSAASIVMLPPFPEDGTWTEAATGAYDDKYRKIGAAIVKKRPNAKTAIRFAWEANGSWYPWSINKTGGSDAFIQGFRHAVDAMREGAGDKASNLVIVYSIAGLDDKGQGDPLTVTYPGDKWVDVIGEDMYDDFHVTTSNTRPEKVKILDRIYSFAKEHGKWMSIDEWGLHHTDGDETEGKDNPAFIRAMLTWIKSHQERLAWEQYFQDDAQDNVNSSLFSQQRDSNPKSRDAYLDELNG